MTKFFIMGACTATLAFATLANAGASNCCFANGAPGCDDATCQDAVCAVDPFCCDTAWDGICASEAATFCPDICDGSIVCPPATNSCFSSGGPGCSDAECCEAVCAIDSFCCQVAWDGICVSEAFATCEPPLCCNLFCPADLNYDGQVDGGDLGILLADWSATGTCSNLDGAGGVDGGDLGILLAAWGSCGRTAEGEVCGDDTNGGCNVPIIGDSNCCVANGGLGCDDADCTLAVCGVDPFCCDTAWDGICASEALTLCPTLCQQGVPSFGSIACGQTISGTAWADGNFRDTDWYQITIDSPTTITLTMQSQLPMVFGVVDTGGIPDCGLASAINPFGVTGFCGEAQIVDFCLGAGTWWIFAAPNGFSGFPCGANNAYWLTLDCGGECKPLACGNAGHDCFTAGGPFCDDVDCCNTVCGVDPFCCDVAWDGICVSEAQSFCVTCEVECVGTPEGEPCGSDTNGGCNSFPPVFGSISCGETICGTGWAAGGTRDTDWYQITTGPGNTVVTITSFAQFPVAIGIVDTGGDPDCGLATALNPFATGNACAETTISNFCLGEGTWWLFIAPSVFDGFPCDSGKNDYSFTLICSNKECTALGCGNAGHDCFTAGGPFCDDIACCELVCGLDPFCCDTAWDAICVDEALSFCGADPITNDECVDAIAVGSGSTAFTTIGATTSGPALDPSCERGFGLAFVNDIWFTHSQAATGTMTVSLCGSGYDTRLAVYSGTCDNLVLVACNDDSCGGTLQSELSFTATGGTTYIIRVGGFSGSGTGTMTITP